MGSVVIVVAVVAVVDAVELDSSEPLAVVASSVSDAAPLLPLPSVT
ncbi:MAG: hypothetical protein K1X88_10785 [Nannocystaceae bacterium]|nr:hypothetical protein [Nannocystaceae bacterium]